MIFQQYFGTVYRVRLLACTHMHYIFRRNLGHRYAKILLLFSEFDHHVEYVLESCQPSSLLETCPPLSPSRGRQRPDQVSANTLLPEPATQAGTLPSSRENQHHIENDIYCQPFTSASEKSIEIINYCCTNVKGKILKALDYVITTFFPLKCRLQTRVFVSIKQKGETVDLVILELEGTFSRICLDNKAQSEGNLYNFFILNVAFLLVLLFLNRNFVLRLWASNF